MKKPNIVEVETTVRTGGSKESQKLREAGMIPAVIYGPKLSENINVSVPEKIVDKLLSVSEKEIVRLKVDGKTYDCTLKDSTFHPVTDRVLHVDFYNLDKDTPFTFVIPIRLEGTPAGLTEGGRLYQPLREIQVKCFPEHIPAEFVVNVAKLKIGQSLKVRRVKAQNMEIVTAGERTIVVIRPPKGTTVSITEADDEDEESTEEAAPVAAEATE
jgi:large subunit ribosomal protein L25